MAALFALEDLFVEIGTMTDGPAIVGPCDENGVPISFIINANLELAVSPGQEDAGVNLQIYTDGILAARVFKEITVDGDVGHVSFTVEIKPPSYAAFRSQHMLEVKVFNQTSSADRFYALTYLHHRDLD